MMLKLGLETTELVRFRALSAKQTALVYITLDQDL
jgi:hypothetical protein